MRIMIRSITIFLLLTGFIFNGCSNNDNEKENSLWGRAAKFVKTHSSEAYMKNEDGIFISMEQKHTPSNWVAYFFSTYSTRNWISENDEYAEYSRGPILPAGIVLSQSTKRAGVNSPQLVVKADDPEYMIEVVGYDYPDTGVVYRNKWKFPELD